MELTIDQAMQQGINAHKNGNLNLAERFYRTILETQPFHPDANHNLGILAISSNNSCSALNFLRTALNENPKNEQFWLSYIEALIIERKFREASKAVLDGKRAGVNEEKLKKLSLKLPTESASDFTSNLQKRPRLSRGRKRIASNKEKKKPFKKGLKNLGPPKEFIDNLNKDLENKLYGNAENLSLRITREFPGHQYAWSVLSTLLLKRGAFSEALKVNHQALRFHSESAEAHNNIGLSFQANGMLEDAVLSMGRAIELRPDYSTAHYNFGNIAQALGRLEKAEKSYRKAIGLESDYVNAHYNLGNVRQELERFDEAEESYRKAIAIKPCFAEAYFGLGCVLEVLGKADEAERSYLEAITLRPSFAEAHSNIGCIISEKGDLDSALDSFQKAYQLKPDLRINDLRLKVVSSAAEPKTSAGGRHVIGVANGSRLNSNFLISNRVAEPDLISQVYRMASRNLDFTKDARFGTGFCSPNFLMFEEKNKIIKKVSLDLIKIIRYAVQSDVYVYDSFFNILKKGGGSLPHHHVKLIDKQLGLSKQKYSLVYYLSVGDQKCGEPGLLRLYAPDEDILPRDGMIVIMPADRRHSAVYSGEKDRIMIGVNFYSLEF